MKRLLSITLLSISMFGCQLTNNDYTNPPQQNACPYCGAELLSYRHIGAEIWCPNCGAIIQESSTEPLNPH